MFGYSMYGIFASFHYYISEVKGTGVSIDSFRRKQLWFRQLFQYFIVGGIAALCDLGVFAFLAQYLEINYLISTLLSFLVGTAVNFFICLKFVFSLREHSWVVASWRKLISSVASLALNMFIMFALVDILAFDRISFDAFPQFDGLLFTRVLAIGAAFFLNFVLTKYYAFKDY